MKIINFFKKINITLTSLVLVLALTGCEGIFEDKNAKYRIKPLDISQVEKDYYYIKNGTKFYNLCELETSSKANGLNAKKNAWIGLNNTLIPNLYKDELIAKVATEIKTDPVTVERYKDCNYSIGIQGAAWDGQYITIDLTKNVVEGSSAQTKFENKFSNIITIESINGIPANINMLNEAGIFKGLEQDKEYDITYYAGTYYGKSTIIADTHFLQCYEIFSIKDVEITKNGYLGINFPQDMKTGYYKINDGKYGGFFRYYDDKRENIDTANVDYNIPYYTDENAQLEAFSQQFTFNLDQNTVNMAIHAVFDPISVDTADNKVNMLIKSPDGKQIKQSVDKNEGEIICGLTESSAGKWTINIAPQTIMISSINIEEVEDKTESTCDEFTLNFDESHTGITVYVEYQSEDNTAIVTGQIIAEDGTSYDLEKVKNLDNAAVTRYLEKDFSYLEAGKYTVKVYHYPDSKIIDANFKVSEKAKDIEIITIEE